MILFHVHITSTFPLAVPLEWNLFMIFGILFLFGHYGDVPFSSFDSLPLLLILLATSVAIPVLGNFRPDLVSFLPAMRYYAGNWATTQWLFRKDTGAEAKLDREVKKPAPVVVEQLSGFYGPEMAEYLLNKGLAFRAMHSHGRALLGAAAACGRRRRGVQRPRGRARLRRRQRLELRRRSPPQRAADRGGPGTLRFRARRRPRRHPRVAAGPHPAPALPDRRRRDRADRGGLGERRRHGRGAALARRVVELPGRRLGARRRRPADTAAVG